MGIFHLKISLSYTYALEFVPNAWKSTMTTLITAFDSGSPLFACIFFKFFRPDEELLLKIHFWFGFAGCIVFLIFIPESPRWLFLSKGANSAEAINVLNYIAWFNGSSMIIPQDATFDIIGQVLEESNASLNMTSLSRLTNTVNQTNFRGKGSIFKEIR